MSSPSISNAVSPISRPDRPVGSPRAFGAAFATAFGAALPPTFTGGAGLFAAAPSGALATTGGAVSARHQIAAPTAAPPRTTTAAMARAAISTPLPFFSGRFLPARDRRGRRAYAPPGRRVSRSRLRATGASSASSAGGRNRVSHSGHRTDLPSGTGSRIRKTVSHSGHLIRVWAMLPRLRSSQRRGRGVPPLYADGRRPATTKRVLVTT